MKLIIVCLQPFSLKKPLIFLSKLSCLLPFNLKTVFCSVVFDGDDDNEEANLASLQVPCEHIISRMLLLPRAKLQSGQAHKLHFVI